MNALVGANAIVIRTEILLLLLLASIGCTRQIDKRQSKDDSSCFDSERNGLRSISSDVDMTHIRIWYSHTFLDRVPVVSLRQSQTGEWSGDMFLIIWNFDKQPISVQEEEVKDLPREQIGRLLIKN